MNLIVYTTSIVILLCLALYATRRKSVYSFEYQLPLYKYSKLLVFLFACVLIFVEGFRFGYQDTTNYKGIYAYINENLTIAIRQNTNIEPGYVFIQWLLKKINRDPQFIIIVSALFITTADIRFIKKYAYDLVFSLYLYFLFSFIGNMNGIRQIIAASIVTFAFPWIRDRKLVRYFIVVALASTIHKSALILFPLSFIISGKRWNYGLVCFLVFCLFSTFFPGGINYLLGQLAADSYAEYINYGAGANLLHVFVYGVVLVLGILYHIRSKNKGKENRTIDVLINMQAISFGFMMLATRMAQYARIGMYMRHTEALLIPYLIDKTMDYQSRRFTRFLAALLYFMEFAMTVYVSNARGYYNVLFLDFSIFTRT